MAKEFVVGDRVRVRPDLAGSLYAGRSGAVVCAPRAGDAGDVHYYQVRLDGDEVLNALLHPRQLAPEGGGEVRELDAGDRVRVRNLPAAASYAGRKGTVTWVRRALDGTADVYQVRLDGPSPHTIANRVVFRPDELEPEAGD
jgi:hypothetical protein